MIRFAPFAVLSLLPATVHATTAIPVPEPETLALAAIGVAAAVIVAIRNRRK